MVEFGEIGDTIDKAGFNQARNIAEILSNLLGSYVLYMNLKQYDNAVKTIRRIHDIISPKLKEEETKKVDGGIEQIEIKIPEAMQLYYHNGSSYVKNPELNRALEKAVEEVFRFVNKLQDKYGYGMTTEEDHGL